MSPPCPDSIAIRKRSLITEIFVLSILLSLFLGLTLPQTYASTSTYKFTYTFYVENGWLWEYWEPHTLYVSITQSLYDYYKGRDHSCY
ncbi:MAG: hypothetical protein QXZ02_04185, partial [Candidatus Bathyarchaeia archaeon]